MHHLHVPGDSPVHRLAPEAKLVGLALYVSTVALAPRRSVAVFIVAAVALAVVAGLARLGPRTMVVRLVPVAPFLAFALLVPFVAGGERTEVLGLRLSVEGLWAAGTIGAKALLGASAAIVLTATTPIPAILRGLAVLRVPAVLVSILAFTVRYLDLLADQLGRMRDAMTARAHDPRWLWQARPIASSAGALFVRSYERGERVHLAMLARGFTGAVPVLDIRRAARTEWAAALAPALAVSAALVVMPVLR